jgi:tetratricopeptide (TPR) repeat protein
MVNTMKIYLTLFVCANLVLLSACGKQRDSGKTPSVAVANARKLYDAGQFRAARQEIEAAVKADPKLSEAHFLAGQIAERMGDPQTALAEYIGADVTAPGSEEGRAAAAAILLRARAYKLAEEWIARCLADRPSDQAMKAYRALLEERLGESRKALSDALSVLAENKGDVVANAVLAEQALRRKDPAGALIKIEAGLLTDASDKDLLQLKAQALSQRDSPAKAIEIYKALVAVDPMAPEYRVALAELLANSAGVEQGEQALRAGVEAAPGNIDMHMRLVAFIARHRDKRAAIAELLAAIAAAPDSTAYDIALADVYAQEDGFDAAAKILNGAMIRTQSDPAPAAAHAAAQLALARLLIAHNDTATARTILDSMIKSKPGDEVLLVRGQLMLRDQNPAAAIQDFLSVATRQPANATVFTSLAEAYLQNDQPKEAIAALRRVLSLMPSDLGTLRRIIDIQSSFGEAPGARQTVDDFLEHNTDSVDGHAIQIRLAIQSKDWTAAEVALSQLHQTPDAEQQAIELDAEIKEARSQYRDAADLYRRLIAWKDRSRFDVPAARAFARTSIAAGQSAQAMNSLAQFAKNVAPADLASFDLILANLADNSGQADKASGLIESVIQREPSSPTAYLQQAAALVRRKEVAKALAVLDRGIAAGAMQEPLLLARAEIQSQNGKIDDLIVTYREALRVNPKSTIAANELANLLADQTRPDTVALRQARDLLQRNALVRNQAILDTLAWSDYRLGDFEKAKALLDLAGAEQSGNPQLRFHYGAVLIALGEIKGKKIIEDTLNDNYPGRDEAKKIIGAPNAP